MEIDRVKTILKIVAALLVSGSTPLAAQVVRVDGGSVSGKAFEGGGIMFRGIPFAAPPVENLRWKPPQPVLPWTGVRESVDQPASCIQNDQGWNKGDYNIGREDCLTLDVRTPAMGGRKPVLVWIHGGSNRAGGPNDIMLSDVGKQVVLVGIRYRLGIFGFLSHRQLTAEQGGSGNYGIMDQIAALQWVQRNIAKFGGDPGNVTIAGESAGSQDVSLLLAAPAARTLFHKAIMESGTPGFGFPFRSLKEAERIGDQADSLLGTGGSIEKLRRMSVPALLAVDLKLHDEAVEADSMVWLRTTIDGRAIPQSPRDLLRQAPARSVILGTNRIEFGVERPHRDALVAKAFEGREPQARSYYRMDQPDPPSDPRLGSLDDQIGTDVIFRCPAANLARLLASAGARVWQYEFDHSPGGGPTRHAVEIQYAFWNKPFAPGLSLNPYWLNFVETGNPNGPTVPQWPEFTVQAPKHVLFDARGVTTLGPLRPEICSLTDRL
jgi:para-nitrobenzyl esterase